MRHELKIERRFLLALLDGTKTFEIRKNDRGYHVGDVLSFSPLNPEIKNLRYEYQVTHIHHGLGLRKGYVAMAVRFYGVGPKGVAL